MGVNHSTVKSFSFAFSGIKEAIKKEPNLKIHLTLAVIVLVAAYFLNFSPNEWLILTFTVALVIIFELLNTALESVINLVSPEVKPEARVAKDISAAMVLVAAILAVFVGALLFVPKILNLFGQNVY